MRLRAIGRRGRSGSVTTVAFGFVLGAAAVATPFMPDPPSARAFAVQTLLFYALLALGARAEPRA